MSSEATTVPLRGAVDASAEPSRPPSAVSAARARRETIIAAVALGAIVLLSLGLVTLAANRPSGLAPTTHNSYFPGWMAGPLGGLWPGLTRNGNTLKYMFTGGLVAMFVAYLVLLRHVRALTTRTVVAAIVAVHVVFLIAPPLALTDVFNYINYGRMEVVHHLNPYTTIPIVEPHNDPAFILSNWHELLSPYGPLFTLVTFAVVPLGVAGSFWALKALLVVASLALIGLTWACARKLGRDPLPAIVLVGLNPIVLVWGLGGDHNDFLMMLCIMTACYLLLVARARGWPGSQPAPSLRERLRALLLPLEPEEIGAGAALAAAAAFKASGAILIPVALAYLLRHPRALVQVLIGLVGAGLVLAAASLYAFGLHIPDLSTQSSLVTAYSIPNLLGLALAQEGETETLHTILTCVLGLSLVACCVLAYRRHDGITAAGWASVALLVTLAWVLPWYVLWVLPLTALSRSRRLRAATLALSVYLIVAWAPASGLLWNAIGFHPSNTQLGKQHQRIVRELLNQG